MTTSSAVPPSREVWFSTVWLSGAGCFASDSWPVIAKWEDDEGEVAIAIHDAEPGPQLLGRETLKQRVDLTVTAAEQVAPDVAFKAVSFVADTLCFGTARRVEVSAGTLSTAPPDVTTGDHKTILSLSPVPPTDSLREVTANYLAAMGKELGDLSSERGRRVVRSLSWLRRSLTTADPVLAFSSLAFAMESLVALLPEPPVAASPTKERSRKKNKKPGTSEVIRHFALAHASTTESNWSFVGGLRHSLFHGGVHEDLKGQEDLVLAAPILRHVVVVAIKHVLAIPADRPPEVTPQMPVLGIPRVVMKGAIRTSEHGI